MISVRQAGEEDVERLAELHRLVHDVHRDRMPERFKPTEAGAVAEWFRSKLGKPNVRAWIAESDGMAVGYLLEGDQDRPETPFRYGRLVCHMEQLAVVPELRRKGVARALVDRVLEAARARGVQDVEGHSWHFNHGTHELLRLFGFQSQIIRFSRTLS